MLEILRLLGLPIAVKSNSEALSLQKEENVIKIKALLVNEAFTKKSTGSNITVG